MSRPTAGKKTKKITQQCHVKMHSIREQRPRKGYNVSLQECDNNTTNPHIILIFRAPEGQSWGKSWCVWSVRVGQPVAPPAAAGTEQIIIPSLSWAPSRRSELIELNILSKLVGFNGFYQVLAGPSNSAAARQYKTGAARQRGVKNNHRSDLIFLGGPDFIAGVKLGAQRFNRPSSK